MQFYSVKWMPLEIAGYNTGFWVLLLPAVFTLLSVIDYINPNRALIKKMLRP